MCHCPIRPNKHLNQASQPDLLFVVFRQTAVQIQKNHILSKFTNGNKNCFTFFTVNSVCSNNESKLPGTCMTILQNFMCILQQQKHCNVAVFV